MVRRGAAFCNFELPTLAQFKKLGGPTFFEPGDVVFEKGHTARGVWIVCDGFLNLTTFPRTRHASPLTHDGRPGDVLGLDEAISGKRLRTTAVAVTRCRLRFVPLEDFRSFISHDINACLRVLHYL
jgi:CRP-like cAMP-binding protein